MSKAKRSYTLPVYERQDTGARVLYLELQRKGYGERLEGGSVVMTEVPTESDPQVQLTLKRLGAPPCRVKVEKDEEVPAHIVAFWRNKGIEVEPVGVIKARFRGSEREYIYPYKVAGGDEAMMKGNGKGLVGNNKEGGKQG